MNRFDRVFGELIIGALIPAVSICAFWWTSYLLGINMIPWFIAGAAAGIVLDVIFLDKLVKRFYHFNPIVLVVIYIIYSVGFFGFFMGVPVFNTALGIIAGLYVGRKMRVSGQNKERYKTEIKKAMIFSSIILLLICIASAYLALTDPYTKGNLEGMFKLNFELTDTIIWAVIILGGLGLLALQNILLVYAGAKGYKMNSKRLSS